MSKPIGKADDSAKEFIINILDGDKTRGFDVDSIYYSGGRWKIIEFLKCENENVTPHTSDPKYYPWNWKKFYSLYQVAQVMSGDLILVNYSDRDHDKHEVRIMKVDKFDYDTLRKYVKTNYDDRPDHLEYMTFSEDEKITYDEFKIRFRQMNADAKLPQKFVGNN